MTLSTFSSCRLYSWMRFTCELAGQEGEFTRPEGEFAGPEGEFAGVDALHPRNRGRARRFRFSGGAGGGPEGGRNDRA
eukprot:588718-Prorocentrum_minimum.AAC.1